MSKPPTKRQVWARRRNFLLYELEGMISKVKRITDEIGTLCRESGQTDTRYGLQLYTLTELNTNLIKERNLVRRLTQKKNTPEK